MIKDEMGKRYGRLVVVGSAASRGGKACWNCRCDCGSGTQVTGDRLRTGMTKSCGCLAVDTVRSRSLKHGHAVGRKWSRTYRSWNEMWSRCTRPTASAYHKYGAKGIRVEELRWESFSEFLSDMGERPMGTTLDRIKNSGGYSKSNCKWSTPKEQSLNRTSCRLITWGGETKPLSSWCESLNLNYMRVYQRLFRLGWTVDEAFQP